MARKGHAGILNVEDDASLGALITSLMPVRDEVHASLMKADAVWKPKLRLIAPTTRTFVAEAADAIPETFRVNCIPVKGSDRVCALNYPVDRLAPPKLMLDFPKRHLNNQDAYMQLKRGKEPQTIAVSSSPTRAPQRAHADQRQGVVIDRLMAPVQQRAEATARAPGELPMDLQSAIADFWQRQMRCHVVAAVCAPDDATRPLAFESITLSRARASADSPSGWCCARRCTARRSGAPASCTASRLCRAALPVGAVRRARRWTSCSPCAAAGVRATNLRAGYGACPLHGSGDPRRRRRSRASAATARSRQLGCSHFIRRGQVQALRPPQERPVDPRHGASTGLATCCTRRASCRPRLDGRR